MLKKIGSYVFPVRWYAALVAFAILSDQVTKYLAFKVLTDAGKISGQLAESATMCERFLWVKHPQRVQVVSVLENFWHFRYTENPGAAWGFLANADFSWRTPFFLVLSFLAMGFITLYFRQTSPEQKLVRLALSMVLGGAVGNFIDRVRLGYVIDFIDWHWYDLATWPTFNVADSFISVGVVFLLIDSFIQSRQIEHIQK